MYKIVNGQVAVPATSVDLTLSSRPFPWCRCKSTEAGYCEVSYWELQTVLQYQNSERLGWNSASVRRVSWLFSTV